MEMFKQDLSERKRILRKICKTHNQWKIRMVIFTILNIVTLGICVFTVYLLCNFTVEVEGALLIIGVGVIFACVPFFISLSVKNRAKFKCALPYSSYANGTLVLKDKTLTYIFWRVGPNEPAAYNSKRAVYNDEDKFIYTILKSDIKSLVIKDDVCLIKGNGEFKMPEWADEDFSVNSDIVKNFSFILAFTEKNAVEKIKEWGY